jgi:hypothetical protein
MTRSAVAVGTERERHSHLLDATKRADRWRQGKWEISYHIMICGIAIAVTTLLLDRGEDLSEPGKPCPRLAKADPCNRRPAVERQQRGEDNGARRPEPQLAFQATLPWLSR